MHSSHTQFFVDFWIRRLSFVLCLAFCVANGLRADSLALNLRKLEQLPGASNGWRTVVARNEWDAAQTAIVVCDMWDKHWCPDTSERVDELAPVMNRVLHEARRRGVQIIHCPSETMQFYENHPGRRLAQSAPKVQTRIPLQGWCSLKGQKEPSLPIDDSDGGCDGCADCPSYRAWTRQHPAIDIVAGDAITDSTEAFYLMRLRGITNVIVMGVHENMCVLGRPFSIRQMVADGQNVVLMRDMTDSMYHHRKRPYVSHFVGTDLVCEHIEKYWCPSITSADFLGGQPFHFKDDTRKVIGIITGENEYDTEHTLEQFTQSELVPRGFQIEYIRSSTREGDPEFSNISAISRSDALIVSVRRRTPPAAMIQALRSHVDEGKPIIGIRTASHAFDAKPSDEAHAAWASFDDDILGADYQGHYGNKPPKDAMTVLSIVSTNSKHPILTGIRNTPFSVTSHLYKYRSVQASVTPLVQGHVDGRNDVEPVAWINTAANRRVFYTSLGNPDDFQLPAFRRLLLNGILWSLHEFIPPAEPEAIDYVTRWQPMKVPGTWDDNSGGRLSSFDGIAWYRCRVTIPVESRLAEALLEVDEVDNAHEAFVNGIKVGGSGSFPPDYSNGLNIAGVYKISPEVLQISDPVSLAIRVYDHGGKGGFKGGAPRLRFGDHVLSLKGNWEFRSGDQLQWAKSVSSETPLISVDAQIPAARSPNVPNRSPLDLPQESDTPALTASEAANKFEVADDLDWEQVLSEPTISQPVFLNFDERGRMWVVEYRQYPMPAGLQLLSHDSVWRNVYDRVPPPPPNHFRGADRISIHEDTHGNGHFDKHTTFVEGLNIVTSVERGRGGVWILNPPYLLFYPDANNDDIPDGDPEVRLSGFGLEDTHSVANSLRWGPDGWLYGAQGSTVTGNIIVYGPDGTPLNTKPIYSQGQNIWRYHPERRLYEVFSEGGGNAFGCEIDSQGRVFSGHNGGDTRGFHYAQGAYLQKGFEKHGPLSNPYAFGYFPPMPHPSVPRFTHNFVVYEGDSLPARYRGHLLGVEPMQGRLVNSEILPDQSSFRTRDLSRPVSSADRWFRPVDIKMGPEGAIYICDWYDQQVNHFRNHEGKIDKTNGRIYRLKTKGAKPERNEDLGKYSSQELVSLLRHPNRWKRQAAQRLLADRRDKAVLPQLVENLGNQRGQIALESFWAINSIGGWNEEVLSTALRHSEASVRAWATRAIGDDNRVSAALMGALEGVAKTELNLEVRNQLASTSRRISPEFGLRLIRSLILHDTDSNDNRMPLLIWWAMEARCTDSAESVLKLFSESRLWDHPIVRDHLLSRLCRRWVQPGTTRELELCARLFELAPRLEHRQKLMEGFELAQEGRTVSGLPDSLIKALSKDGFGSIALGVRMGDARATQRAIRLIAEPEPYRPEQLASLAALGDAHVLGAAPSIIRSFRGAVGDDQVRRVALAALQRYEDSWIADAVVGLYPRLGIDSIAAAQTLLSSRPQWTRVFLDAIERKWATWDSSPMIQPEIVPVSMIQRMREHRDPSIRKSLDKLWPVVAEPTSAEYDSKIQHAITAIRASLGNPYAGRELFQNRCGVCHRLFGKGGELGPDLTVYKRDDLGAMLLSIIHPSAEVREGYEASELETTDGRLLSGIILEQDSKTVALRGLDGQVQRIARTEIQKAVSSKQSLMPEGLLEGLNQQQLCDLFAYLRSTQPLVGEPPKRLQ